MATILETIGMQLRHARHDRVLSQAELARRIGRDPARISEFERDLAANRMGRDRLTLLAEICDALGLVPVIVPRAQAASLLTTIPDEPLERAGRPGTPRAFDELFVDLDDHGDEQH